MRLRKPVCLVRRHDDALQRERGALARLSLHGLRELFARARRRRHRTRKRDQSSRGCAADPVGASGCGRPLSDHAQRERTRRRVRDRKTVLRALEHELIHGARDRPASRVEVSVAGEITEGLNIVAGYVYLDPELIGPAVDEGALGPVPVGPIPHVATLDVSYGPERWNGFALEGGAEYHSCLYRVSGQRPRPCRR